MELSKWASPLLLLACLNAGAAQLTLAAPGEPLYLGDKPKSTPLAPSIAARGWQALAIRDGALILTPATELGPSGWLTVQGKHADRLREGKPVTPEPDGKALKLPPDALFALRLSDENGAALPLPGAASASALAPAVLEQGWGASAMIAGKPWTLSTRSQKRPDGKMLAGSLELIGQRGGEEQVLLPVAGGMAFARQELLWLGDLDGDARPDLVLRRTHLTGDVSYVMVLGHERALVTIPDVATASYFSSGVEPESNGFSWAREAALPAPFLMARQGGFTITGEVWTREIGAPAPLLPKVIAERQFKLQGETIRFTLDYVPRVSQELGWGNAAMWNGPVLVRVWFRGRSQVLMEADAPDDDNFTLAFGLRGGSAAIQIGYHPHYNNGMQYHWVFDGERFRRVLAIHEQGC